MQSAVSTTATFMGVVHGNTVTLDGYDMTDYEGFDVCVTLKNVDREEESRMTAFNNLLKFAGTVDSNIDYDAELETALWEKYDSID